MACVRRILVPVKTQEEGIHATNQDFIRYDQVEKRQSYHLAESETEDQFDDDFVIRTCDMRAPTFVQDLGDALREIGFAILDGHGVDPALYDEAERRIDDIFTRLSLEEKMRFRAERYGSVNQGYFPIEETSDIHPDLVEGWVWCRRAFDIAQQRDGAFRPEDFWPRAEYEPQYRPLVEAHEPLFKPIAQAMFQGLGVDPHVYDEKLTQTNFGLRLNYYPPMTGEQDESGAGRLLGHEDVDLFTILPATRVDGLQVWNHRSGKWVRMRAPKG